MNQRLYSAVAARSGRWWALHVPDVPGVFTQARTLKEAREMVRSALSLALQVPKDSFGVSLDVHVTHTDTFATSDAVTTLISDIAEKEEAAERAAALASEATRRAATSLRDAGLTLRDTGELLGVSYQRVQQLISASRRESADRTGRRKVQRQKVFR